MLLSHSHTKSRLALSAISPFFVDPFGRSLRFCYLEFDKEAISDGCRSEKYRYRLEVWILSDCRELSFFCSLWTLFLKIICLRFSTPGASVGLFCHTPGIPLARRVPRAISGYMLLTGIISFLVKHHLPSGYLLL